jgi:hypothetical protein
MFCEHIKNNAKTCPIALFAVFKRNFYYNYNYLKVKMYFTWCC